MTKKIFRSIIFVSVVTFSACFIIVMGILYSYFNNQLLEELKSEITLVERGIEMEGIDYFDKLEFKNRITWIDENGNVIYDSDIKADKLENHSEREEVYEAFENGKGSSQRYSNTFSVRTVYFAKLLDDGSVIRISSEQYSLLALLMTMMEPMLIVILIAIIMSILLADKLSKKILKPINDIDLDRPDIDENYPEITPLIKKINRQNDIINKQIEELKKSEEEFMTITSNMSEGLLIIDNNTEILSYNNGILKLLNKEEAKIGESAFTLNRMEPFRKSVYGALDGAHVEKNMEYEGKVYQILANPVFEDKKVNGAVILMVDVTEKEQREALRREFTSNVSHELKTPLTSIYGISEIMMNGIVKPEDIGKFSADIYRESGRLISLVNDIIRLSQLDENSISEEKTPVDLYSLAISVANRLEPLAESRDIKILVSGEKTVVNGIKTILDEIIYNLVENGIKYNRDGGKVEIFIGIENEYPVIRVSDTGIGIPKEDVSRVFERFYRVDKSHSKKIGGTGLGLSIVKHGAYYHGATVRVENSNENGTSFIVKFRKESL